MPRLQVVVGGQFGSEGKGAVAAYLCGEIRKNLLAIRVGGPNAGHTVIGNCPPGCPDNFDHKITTSAVSGAAHTPNTHPWRLRQIPVAAVSNREAMLLIADGSEIDPDVLISEIEQLDAAGYRASDRLVVSGQATVITQEHKDREISLTRAIGSTGKGIGAARADRIMRRAMLYSDLDSDLPGQRVEDSSWLARQFLRGNQGSVVVEGTQGYGLGLHTGYYPTCTSNDARAIDFLAMAGISPWQVTQEELTIWVVYRLHPIRVAGNSGPLSGETTWENLGLPQELTTVTRKVRRVGVWDPTLAAQAAIANGAGGPCVRAALTMADHGIPDLAGATSANGLTPLAGGKLGRMLDMVEQSTLLRTGLIGTGPSTMIDLREEGTDAR